MTLTDPQTSSEVAVTKSGIPIRNLWHMFLYDWDAWRMTDHWRGEVDNAPSLDALLGLILTNLIQQRLRIGLGRNYRQDESLISGVRGRVDFAQSLKRLAFQHGRAYCRYQSFSPNVLKNQIVRSTLVRLVQIGDFGPEPSLADDLRRRMRQVIRCMDSVELIELKPDLIRREQLGRHDADYALMLAISYLVLQRLMPTETTGHTQLPSLDRDAFTLHQVYERFVAKFYRARLSEWNVSAQPKLAWPSTISSSYLPIMSPDLMLAHRATGKLVVLDTKFTQHVLTEGRWDKLVFDRAHLFQIYAYLKSQEHLSEHHGRATGVLLYPTVKHRLSEVVRIQGHDIRWETIDLAQRWEDVEADLLGIIAATLSE